MQRPCLRRKRQSVRPAFTGVQWSLCRLRRNALCEAANIALWRSPSHSDPPRVAAPYADGDGLIRIEDLDLGSIGVSVLA